MSHADVVNSMLMVDIVFLEHKIEVLVEWLAGSKESDGKRGSRKVGMSKASSLASRHLQYSDSLQHTSQIQ